MNARRARRLSARAGATQLRALAAGVSLSASAACYHAAQLALLVRPPSASPSTPALYTERCSSCHGAAGRGDGAVGRQLDPRPRDFSDATWQRDTSDDRIRVVIRRGGAAVGLSPSMAAHPELSDDELDVLLAYIRHVGRETAERGG
ncbi:MAG TPA: cytochrome c [Myxococcota bacterium]|nr:cytochrome c [Myxococcota bacterium]